MGPTLKRIGIFAFPLAVAVALIIFFVFRNKSDQTSPSSADYATLLASVPVWFSPSSAQRSHEPKKRLESFFSAMGWNSPLSVSDAKLKLDSYSSRFERLNSSILDSNISGKAVHLNELLEITPSSDFSEFSQLPSPSMGPVFSAIGGHAEIFKTLVEADIWEHSSLLSKAVIAVWAFPEMTEISMDAFTSRTCERLQKALQPRQQLPDSWKAVCESDNQHPTFSKLFMNIENENEFFVILASARQPDSPLFEQYIKNSRFIVHSWGRPALDRFRQVVDPHLFKMCSQTTLGKYCEALVQKEQILNAQDVSIDLLRRLSDRLINRYGLTDVKVDKTAFPVVNLERHQPPAVTVLETAILFNSGWPTVRRLAAVVAAGGGDDALKRELELGTNLEVILLVEDLKEECKKEEHNEKAFCQDMDAELTAWDMSNFERRTVQETIEEMLKKKVAETCFYCTEAYDNNEREKIKTCASDLHFCCKACVQNLRKDTVWKNGVLIRGRECPLCREVYHMKDARGLSLNDD